MGGGGVWLGVGRKRDYNNFCWVQQVSALPTTDYDKNYCKQAGVE